MSHAFIRGGRCLLPMLDCRRSRPRRVGPSTTRSDVSAPGTNIQRFPKPFPGAPNSTAVNPFVFAHILAQIDDPTTPSCEAPSMSIAVTYFRHSFAPSARSLPRGCRRERSLTSLVAKTAKTRGGDSAERSLTATTHPTAVIDSTKAQLRNHWCARRNAQFVRGGESR